MFSIQGFERKGDYIILLLQSYNAGIGLELAE